MPPPPDRVHRSNVGEHTHLRAKHSARALAAEHGVPLAPGTGLLTDEEGAASAARKSFPVILKATAGGGGIGMRICEDEAPCGRASRASRGW